MDRLSIGVIVIELRRRIKQFPHQHTTLTLQVAKTPGKTTEKVSPTTLPGREQNQTRGIRKTARGERTLRGRKTQEVRRVHLTNALRLKKEKVRRVQQVEGTFLSL
jgi:hypothetical protein